jgi:hypothetical protein
MSNRPILLTAAELEREIGRLTRTQGKMLTTATRNGMNQTEILSYSALSDKITNLAKQLARVRHHSH